MKKCKPDVFGNVVVLENKTVFRYRKTSKYVSINVFTNDEMALKEFNRITNSYRGCGNRTPIHRTPQAKIHYSQLIIQL